MQKKCESLEKARELIEKEEVIRKINSINFSGKVYLVGGAIRDIALGKKPKDFDFALSSPSDLILFEEAFKKRAFTLGKKPQHAHRITLDPYTIDITTFEGTIEEDLKRRDLTINAIAYELSTGRFIDILEGLKDLSSRIIRFPEEGVIVSDPLRMLKALRHFSTLEGFTLNKESKDAIRKYSPYIRGIAGERIKYEMDLILASNRPYEAIKVAEDTGVLYEIFPELLELKKFDEKYGLDLKTLDHTLLSLKYLKKWNRVSHLKEKGVIEVGYALIFHDLGKPRTFFFDKEKGVVHFFGHEKISMEISEKIMERLRFSHNQKRVILELIRHHMWIFLLCKDTPTLRATKRLILKMGDLTPSLILLTLCDMFGTTQGKRNETTDRVLEYSKELIKMYRDFMIEPPPKIIDGYDLISLGYEEGPFLGQVLREIREKQLTGEITDREQAIEYARERLRFQ